MKENHWDTSRARDISDKGSIKGNLRRAEFAAFEPEKRERLCSVCGIDLNLEMSYSTCHVCGGILLCRDHKHRHSK